LPSIRLTQAAVDKLRPPAEGRVDYWDNQLPGFGLRVSAARPGLPAGKSWCVMYRFAGKKRRETLGTLAQVPQVEAARELAREAMLAARAGKDPAKVRRQAQQDRVSACLERYFERLAARARPSYFTETRRQLLRDFEPAIGHLPIRELSRGDIRDVLDAIVDRGSPASANTGLRAIKAFCSWAVSADLIETSPAAGLKAPALRISRDRWLNNDEIALFWHACGALGWCHAGLFRLLLLTGQRRGEVAGLEWRELDLGAGLWTIPRGRTKTGREHVVHLAPAAVAIISSLPRVSEKYVFVARGERPVTYFADARARLDQAMLELNGGEPIRPWVLHDLRRTAATGMAELGIAHHVADRVLNHTAGALGTIAAVYNRSQYLAERKAALETWARHIEKLVGESEVLRLVG